MNTFITVSFIVLAVVAAMLVQLLFYRRDKYRVVTALKAGGFMRSLDLVKKHKVCRSSVHLILRDLVERGYVQRLGDKPPYLYRWRQK